MQGKEAKDWAHLLDICRRLSRELPDAVFIGGVAVHQHAARLGKALQEMSHDGDFYVSLVGKSALRDRHELRRNPSLSKESVTIEGEDLDVYVERQHALGVAYDEVASYAETIDGIRVAALEHLLVLKIDALVDRRGTTKGDKDERDLARILALLAEPRQEILDVALTAERQETLRRFVGRPNIGGLLGLNAHEASKFAVTLKANVAKLSLGKGGPTRG